MRLGLVNLRVNVQLAACTLTHFLLNNTPRRPSFVAVFQCLFLNTFGIDHTLSPLQNRLLCQPLLQLLLCLLIHDAKLDRSPLARAFSDNRHLVHSSNLFNLLSGIKNASEAEEQHQVAVWSRDGSALPSKNIFQLKTMLVCLSVIPCSFLLGFDQFPVIVRDAFSRYWCYQICEQTWV